MPLAADDGFRLTYDRLRASWQEGTRLLIVNSPNNPTGRIFDRDEIDAIVRFSAERDLIILSDEIYEEIAFAHPNTGPLSRPEARERTVLVSGMSKVFAMPGWRLGYAVGPAACERGRRSLHAGSGPRRPRVH